MTIMHPMEMTDEQLEMAYGLASRLGDGERCDEVLDEMDRRCEKRNAPSHYTLPEGWTWDRVAKERQKWGIDKRQFPLVSALGATAWGVPLN